MRKTVSWANFSKNDWKNETFYKDKMLFEITFSSKEQKKETGIEGGVKVYSYPVMTVQKALLHKTKD